MVAGVNGKNGTTVIVITLQVQVPGTEPEPVQTLHHLVMEVIVAEYPLSMEHVTICAVS